MGPEEIAFLKDLGIRIAKLRQESGISQAKLGEMIGKSQQHIFAVEKGQRRITVTDLPVLAQTLGVTVEDLLGTEEKRPRRGRPSKLEKQFEVVTHLPRKQQKLVSDMLDAIILQAEQS